MRCNAIRVADEPKIPVLACSLDADGARKRIGQWQELMRRGLVSRSEIVDGVRVELQPRRSVLRELERLVAAERACCPFLSFTVEPGAVALVLTVRGPAEAETIVDQLFAGSG
jgi:hypothetical protein